MSNLPKQTNSPVVVRPAMTYHEVGKFINIPWLIYKNDPMWVPPLRLERRFHLSHFNPYSKHGDWQLWIAYQDGKPVGRISAQIDKLHRDRYGFDTGHFGFMESIDNQEVFSALSLHAETWLATRGVRRITGPFNFSINQEIGILVEGFDTPPMVMMTHSAPWYGKLLENQGYVPAKDMFAYKISSTFEFPPVMQTVISRFKDKIKLRPLKRSRLAQEMEILRDIFNDAWADNWGFIPFTEEEFAELGSTLKWLLPDEFVQIAEVDGVPAAFMVGLPNINEVLSELDGNLFPFGWMKLIKHIKNNQITSGRIPLMGVRKKYQNTPLGLALACLIIDAPRQAGIARGIKEVELSWILEDNLPMRHILKSIGSQEYKRYRIYQKDL